MAERKSKDERNDERGESNEEWDRFDSFVKKLAAVPKEEVDEKRREEEREKRAG